MASELAGKDVIANGNWVCSLDDRGNIKMYNGPSNIEAPVTDLIIEPAVPDGNTDWYKTVPTVILQSRDAETYTEEITYRMNLTDAVTYQEPIQLPEGNVSLLWYGTDNHGYREYETLITGKSTQKNPLPY